MDGLNVVYWSAATCCFALIAICVYAHGWTMAAVRRAVICTVVMAASTALLRHWITAPPTDQWAHVWSELYPYPVLTLLVSFAAGFDKARTARLFLFVLLATISRYQFDGFAVMLLAMALAIDFELHPQAGKRGMIGSLCGIAAMWALTYFLSAVLEITNADIIFSASIFCFVHALCFLDAREEALPERKPA